MIFKLTAQTSVYGLRTSTIFLLNVRSAIISLFCIRLFKSIRLYMNNYRVIVLLPVKYLTVWQKETCDSLY